MITFPCGQCGQRQEFAGDLAGREVFCRQCGSSMNLPIPRVAASGGVTQPTPDTVKFPCGLCGQRHRVELSMVGRRTKCRRCGEPMVVPSPPGAAPKAAQISPQRLDALPPIRDVFPAAPMAFEVLDEGDFVDSAQPVLAARPSPRPPKPQAHPAQDVFGFNDVPPPARAQDVFFTPDQGPLSRRVGPSRPGGSGVMAAYAVAGGIGVLALFGFILFVVLAGIRGNAGLNEPKVDQLHQQYLQGFRDLNGVLATVHDLASAEECVRPSIESIRNLRAIDEKLLSLRITPQAFDRMIEKYDRPLELEAARVGEEILRIRGIPGAEEVVKPILLELASLAEFEEKHTRKR